MSYSGPRTPRFYVKTTPNASPTSTTSEDKFLHDLPIISESEPEEGESTKSIADKLGTDETETTTPNKATTFKYRDLTQINQEVVSPNSSPIPQQCSQDTYIISSDEELEKSMIEFEEKIAKDMGY